MAGVLLVSAHNWRAFASFCTECRVFSAFFFNWKKWSICCRKICGHRARAAVVREEGHGRPP
eukprot:COSAG06_NODE_4179_length_4499_cov_3.188182_4_plen_62_part_00